jgi:hypothetical protein
MGTRSTIALEFADGTIGQVYCHWDGYLSNNGEILLASYTDPFKVRELIDLGDLSSLGAEIGVQHPFDNPGRFGDAEYEAYKTQYRNMCKFYGRDRSEEGVEARYFKDFADYAENHESQGYEYILRTDGNWYVSQSGNAFVLLTDAIAEENALEEQEEAA